MVRRKKGLKGSIKKSKREKAKGARYVVESACGPAEKKKNAYALYCRLFLDPIRIPFVKPIKGRENGNEIPFSQRDGIKP